MNKHQAYHRSTLWANSPYSLTNLQVWPATEETTPLLGQELYADSKIWSEQNVCFTFWSLLAGLNLWFLAISCDIFSYRFLFVCFKDPSLFSLATSIFPWFCCFLLPRFAWDYPLKPSFIFIHPNLSGSPSFSIFGGGLLQQVRLQFAHQLSHGKQLSYREILEPVEPEEEETLQRCEDLKPRDRAFLGWDTGAQHVFWEQPEITRQVMMMGVVTIHSSWISEKEIKNSDRVNKNIRVVRMVQK